VDNPIEFLNDLFQDLSANNFITFTLNPERENSVKGLQILSVSA
jgi:hypothetical protein